MTSEKPKKRGRPPGSKSNKTKVRAAMLNRALDGSPTAAAEWRRLGGTGSAKPDERETDEQRIARSKSEADELLTKTGLFAPHEGESDNRRMLEADFASTRRGLFEGERARPCGGFRAGMVFGARIGMSGLRSAYYDDNEEMPAPTDPKVLLAVEAAQRARS